MLALQSDAGGNGVQIEEQLLGTDAARFGFAGDDDIARRETAAALTEPFADQAAQAIAFDRTLVHLARYRHAQARACRQRREAGAEDAAAVQEIVGAYSE